MNANANFVGKYNTLPTLFQDIGIKNSKKNKVSDSDKAFHDWYRFVLSFPPHLVRKYIDEFQLTENDILLDPFCGTGTTVLEGKLQNIPSIGIEANPVAHFAGSVKIDWDVNVEELENIANEIKETVYSRLLKKGITDNPSTLNSNVKELMTFNSEQEKLILKNSISPLPLHKALVLFEEICKQSETKFYRYLALALAKAAVFDFSNLKFGPEVGIGKIKQDSPVVLLWHNQLKRMIADLKQIQKNKAKPPLAKIYLNDARSFSEVLDGYKVSAVITSPPYPNEKDYTRTTRLESVLLGFMENKADLRRFKKALLRSNTRGIYKEDNDDQYVENFPEIQRIATEIENKRIALGKTSGFEKLYHKVTKLYFGGMAKHLIEMKAILKPNAYLAYVVGDQASYLQVMIRTGHLLAEIAVSLGYELVRIDLFRTRFSTKTKSELNEEVVILRWPG